MIQRLMSFGLVIAVGFLLLVSLVVSAGLAALNRYMGIMFPAMTELWNAINLLVSFGVVTLLFALIYRVLPDVDLTWRDVWLGAVVTARLFTVGKSLIGLYLGTSGVASAYGAAGSVLVLLIWVYYSAQIVLLGAEFTRAWVEWEGAHPRPMRHAKKDPAPRRRGGGREVGDGGTALRRDGATAERYGEVSPYVIPRERSDRGTLFEKIPRCARDDVERLRVPYSPPARPAVPSAVSHRCVRPISRSPFRRRVLAHPLEQLRRIGFHHDHPAVLVREEALLHRVVQEAVSGSK